HHEIKPRTSKRAQLYTANPCSQSAAAMCKKSSCDTCSMPPSNTPPAHAFFSSPPSADLPKEKATWWGCGNHVPMVMDPIPEEERCTCEPKIEKEGNKYPPKGPQPA
ncbi:hypothetical protein LTR16_012346, partial [Cryomyces antarcticus]